MSDEKTHTQLPLVVEAENPPVQPSDVPQKTTVSLAGGQGKPWQKWRGRDEKRRIDMFWARVNKTDGCWLWTGCTNGRYGKLSVGGPEVRAHRFSWELANGPVPDGLNVLHNCDTPLCVRPDHLFLGTQKRNMDDMNEKGRSIRPKGKDAVAHLTAAEVIDMRVAYSVGESIASIAKRFDVHPQNAARAIKKITWKHIP